MLLVLDIEYTIPKDKEKDKRGITTFIVLFYTMIKANF